MDNRPPGKNIKWAFDLTIAAMAASSPSKTFPRLIVGMSLDKAGHRPAENVLTSMANLLTADHLPRGDFVGDRLYYPMRDPDDLQIPLRKAGYAIIGDQIKNQTGVQAVHGGAELVDGHWFCPAMPHDLVTATSQRDNGDIDHDTWQARIDRRTRYLLRPKEAPRPGGSQQFVCPAAGPGATCECPLRPRPTGGRRLTMIPKRDVPDHPDKVCTNTRSLTIPIEVGAKYAQQGPQWGTREWHARYTHPRETIESINAQLKSGRNELLGDHTRRPMAGIAAQSLLVSMLIVSHNIRTIQTFKQHQLRGEPCRTPRRRHTPSDPGPPPETIIATALAPPTPAA
jgi:hypothetical protein